MRFRQAMQWIILSVILFTGLPAIGIWYYHYVKDQRANDPQYQIVALVQTCSQKEPLKTAFLAEMLDLSVDQPMNLFRLNMQDARRKLLTCPLIKEAKVKRISPGTVYVDYQLREPIALLGEWSNTAMDDEGVVFPVKPFLTPKKLPELILGFRQTEIPVWGSTIDSRRVDLAIDLIKALNQSCCDAYRSIGKVDVSKAYARSYGQREISIVFDTLVEKMVEGKQVLVMRPHLLRLSTQDYQQELANYLVLAKKLREEEMNVAVENSETMIKSEPIIIDLRIPHLGFIKNG
jgi:RNase P protein component